MRLFQPQQRRYLCALLALLMILQSVSCGTILYPERIGQTRGPLDPKVVALNTIGLLLFVVPGAIAFAVDFYNGTIYLPTGTYRGQSPDEIASSEWTTMQLPPEIQTREQLGQYLAQHFGHSINFASNDMDVYHLDDPPVVTQVVLNEKEEKGFLKSLDWKDWFSRREAHKKTSNE